ncbi:MAG: XRE family transcriptional regulator [Alcaligenaceae bacterium]|nr:MAG: XRE family transcriptional regulator [Alcaligenaceae bacterium]
MRTSTQNLMLMRAFATELRARRHQVGVSQEELAHLAGVNRTFIAKLELAQNQPSLTALLKIVEGLNVQLPEFLEATLRRYELESDARQPDSNGASASPNK